jgi:hypothetical protein
MHKIHLMSEGQTQSIKTNGKSSRPDNSRQSTENEWIWWGTQYEIDQLRLLKDGDWLSWKWSAQQQERGRDWCRIFDVALRRFAEISNGISKQQYWNECLQKVKICNIEVHEHRDTTVPENTLLGLKEIFRLKLTEKIKNYMMTKSLTCSIPINLYGFIVSYISSQLYSNIYPTRCNVTQFIWKLLYMFRVVPQPIIRSANNFIYCYLPLAAGSSNGVTNTRCCRYGCLRSW